MRLIFPRRKKRNEIMGSNCRVVLNIAVYSGIYTKHSLFLLHPHTLCVCTCKHWPPQQEQSKVIKSLAAPSQFLWEVTGNERWCPNVPLSPPPPPPPPPSLSLPVSLSVTSTDARGGGAPMRCWAHCHGYPTACKHLVCVCVCVCVFVWVGVCVGVGGW